MAASQADKNRNGIIEYNEFIEWLQQPMATVRMGSQGLEYFDLEAWPRGRSKRLVVQQAEMRGLACVRPLYDVYDQDGDGLVSMDEFIGCQTILQNSLGLKSKVSLEARPRKAAGHRCCERANGLFVMAGWWLLNVADSVVQADRIRLLGFRHRYRENCSDCAM
eukprot:Skav233584  [mRNA]  locus=scaffold2520:255747:256735:- [translate_table: standard]